MSTINLVSFVVRTNGLIDVDATMAKFHGELVNYQLNSELEAETIAEAVATVFDNHKGTNFNMPSLVNSTRIVLNVQPDSYITMTDKIEKHLRANASPDRESGALYKISKGKGGGVRRWSDVPVA
jgi:hypothetical protein